MLLSFGVLGASGYVMPLLFPQSVSAWIVSGACIGIGEQMAGFQRVLAHAAYGLPELVRRNSAPLIWSALWLGQATAFGISGALAQTSNDRLCSRVTLQSLIGNSLRRTRRGIWFSLVP